MYGCIMYNADVVFLLLNSPDSARFDEFLTLYAAIEQAGFHTAIATSPEEVAPTAKRLRIIVVDDSESEFDVYAVIEAMRHASTGMAIVLLTHAPGDEVRGWTAGADVCLQSSENMAEKLAGVLAKLACGGAYAESFRAEASPKPICSQYDYRAPHADAFDFPAEPSGS